MSPVKKKTTSDQVADAFKKGLQGAAQGLGSLGELVKGLPRLRRAGGNKKRPRAEKPEQDEKEGKSPPAEARQDEPER